MIELLLLNWRFIYPFHAIGFFLYPLKTSGMFLEGIKRNQWHKMSL